MEPLRRAQAIIARLRRRDLYKYVHEVTIPPRCLNSHWQRPSEAGIL